MPLYNTNKQAPTNIRDRNHYRMNDDNTPTLASGNKASNEKISLMKMAIGLSVTFISLGIFSLSYLWTVWQSCWDVFIRLRRADLHKFIADFQAKLSHLMEYASKIYQDISQQLSGPRKLVENGPFYALSILPHLAYSAVIKPMDVLIWKPFLSLSSSMRRKIGELFFSFIAIAVVLVLIVVRSWFMLVTWFIWGPESDTGKDLKNRSKNRAESQSEKYYTAEFDFANYPTINDSHKADTFPSGTRFRSKSQVLRKSPFEVQSQQAQDSEFVSTQLESSSQEEMVKSGIDDQTSLESTVKPPNEPLKSVAKEQDTDVKEKSGSQQSSYKSIASSTVKPVPKRRGKPRRRHRPVQDIFPQKKK
jgi:hypothetical protein